MNGRRGDDGASGWRTEMTASGTRYVLPARAVPGQRAMGLGLAAFGFGAPALVLFLSQRLWWPPILAIAHGRVGSGGMGSWIGLLGLLLLLLLMLFATRVIRFGLLVAFGRASVTVDGDRITGVNRWGLVRHKKAVERAEVLRVIVEPGLGARPGKPADAPGRDLANLVIDRTHDDEDKRKVGLAHAYPRALIEALAQEIGERIGRPVETEAPRTLRERMGEPDEPTPAPAARVPRPRRATGTLTSTPDGISIELPPVGFFKGSKGLGSFAILWFGFISIFTGVFVASMARKGINGGDVFALAIISVFWLVGIAMVYGALRSGKRRGLIDVVGSDLLITRQSLGGPRSESWSASEIEVVCAGPSGTTVNDRPVLELQVRLHDGGKRGFFPERRDDELRWIAGEVSAALGIGATDGS